MHLFKGSNSLQNTRMAFKRSISYDLLHICIAILKKVGSVHYSCTKINYADLLDCMTVSDLSNVVTFNTAIVGYFLPVIFYPFTVSSRKITTL